MGRVLLAGVLTLVGGVVLAAPDSACAFSAPGIVDPMRGAIAPVSVLEPLPELDLSIEFEDLDATPRWRSARLRSLLDEAPPERSTSGPLPVRFQASGPLEVEGSVPSDPLGPAIRMLVPPDPFETSTRFKVVRPPRAADPRDRVDGWTVQWNLRLPRRGRPGVKLSFGSAPRLLGDPMAGRSAEGELDVTPWGKLSFAQPPRRSR